MDILSKLPFLKADEVDETDDRTLEEIEAEAKAERIRFHREKVRNGPAKFVAPTSGQIRRARKRDAERMIRKNRRRQVRQHLADQREAATIRGHLQAAGVLPYPNRAAADPRLAVKSLTWIVRRFADDRHVDSNGRVEVTEEVVRESLQSALNRWQTIVGLTPTSLSPAYALPVALSA